MKVDNRIHYNNKQINFKSVIYKSPAHVTKNILSAFQPLFIETPRFPRDIFSKNFADVPPAKRTSLHKFANLNEHYNLLYNICDLFELKSFSLEKLKSLFMIAFEKDMTGMVRFSPEELLHISTYSDDTLKFIKPFARQKNSADVFNYKHKDILQLTKFSEEERVRAIKLFKFKLPAKDLIAIVKDKNADASALKDRLNTLNDLYGQDIYEFGVNKYGNDYVVSITSKNDFKTHKYVFDDKFPPATKYKSNVDFYNECFKEKSILKRLNPFKRAYFVHKTQIKNDNLRVSAQENLYALDEIKEKADYLKQLYLRTYKHNFYVLHTGNGRFYEPDIRLPKNLIVDYWKKGAVSQDDLINIFCENAGMIHDSDYKYFALNKIKITPYDNEKYLEIRRNNVLKSRVKIGSDYYNKVLSEVIQNEKQKLQNIKAERKMIVVDGLPGAGKSTIINKILKKDKNAYYTPDSDDIKAMFKEVYKNGEGAPLVHKASSHILKQELIPHVLQQGKNFIYQTTGGSLNINKIIQQAKQHGYDVDFIHIATPKHLSVERSVARFDATGRFIDPYVTMMIFNSNNNEKVFSAKVFSHHKDIRNAYIYENGKLQPVKEGQKFGKKIKL